MGLKSVDRRSLRERSVQEIRASIANGFLRPGEQLVEMKLSQELGVSRGTVREALRTLEEEGLITSAGRGPVYVRSLSPVEVREIYALRAAIEGLAAHTAAIQPDRTAITGALRRALAAFDLCENLLFSERVEIDLAFHELLCELSGNKTLVGAWRRLSGPIRAALSTAGQGAVHGFQTVGHHVTVVDAVEQGDAGAARIGLELHLEESAVMLAAAIEQALDHQIV